MPELDPEVLIFTDQTFDRHGNVIEESTRNVPAESDPEFQLRRSKQRLDLFEQRVKDGLPVSDAMRNEAIVRLYRAMKQVIRSLDGE